MKSCLIKLYPTKKQQEQIDKTIGCCRFLYNQMLAERIESYKNGIKNKPKTENQYKEVYPFLLEASSRALQQSTNDLNNAYKNFFRNVKQGKRLGFPKFKSKHTSKLSYREPQVGEEIKYTDGNIKVLKLGKLKYKGKIEGEVRNVTITNNKDGSYTASVLVDNYNKANDIERKGVVGVDLGLKHLAITSDGNFYKYIDKKLERKIKKQQRNISRKINGSRNKERAKKKFNKITIKQSNIDKHFHYHVIKDIISENQTVCIEKLNVQGMMKNKKLSANFQKRMLGIFRKRLIQKCLMLGVNVIEADRFFASSKICNCCKNKKQDLTLSDRLYCCDKCGIQVDRDFNASLNLRALSAEYVDYRYGGDVRLIEKSFDFNSSKFLGSTY